MRRIPCRRSPCGVITAVIAAVAAAFTVLADPPGVGLAAARASAPGQARVTSISVRSLPNQVAVDPAARSAWVAAGHLVRISEVTQRVSATISVGPNIDFVAVDPGRHAVWTSCSYGLCPLTEVAEATDKVTHQVTGLGTVSGIAVDPRTGMVWVAEVDAAHRSVAVAVSETTLKVVATISLGFGTGHVPGAVTADPVTGTVWVAGIPCSTCSVRDLVGEISEAARQVVHLYGTPARGISTAVVTAVDSRRGTAWLASGTIREPSGTIQVIDIARRRVVRTIRTLWVAPEGIAIDSRAGTVVATGGDTLGTPDSVVLLKESTGAQVSKVPVGFYPSLLTVDPGTGNVYAPIALKNIVTQFRL